MKLTFTLLCTLLLFSMCAKQKTETNPDSYLNLKKALNFATIKVKEKVTFNSFQKRVLLYSSIPRNLVPVNDDNPVISEEQAVEIVQPLNQPSADFVFDYYGIKVNDFFAHGDPRIAMLGVFALEVKKLEDQGISIDTNVIDFNIGQIDQTLIDSQQNGLNSTNTIKINERFVKPLTNTMYRRVEPSISLLEGSNCAISSLGIPLSFIVGSAKSYSIKAILKAARKLATRTLGFIGAAAVVYDLSICLYQEYNDEDDVPN